MTESRKPIPAELPEAEVLDLKALAEACADGTVDLIVVLGPTASGKTRYAVSLARRLRESGLEAEIISADSRQVYRGMDIGTGKDLGEYGEIPFHLIDIEDPGGEYNVYRFQKDFKTAWEDIRGRGRMPLLCGGTGLYINSVTAGYDFKGSRPLSELRDPMEDSRDEGLPRRPFLIGTLVSREERNARIDSRLDARLQEGMIDEIRGLLEQGVPAETLISYGLEYKFVTLYLTGELDYEEMRTRLATAIHQFAKRQMTWFRGMERSGARIHWVEVG